MSIKSVCSFAVCAMSLACARAIPQSADGVDGVVARVSDAVCKKDVVLLGELPSHGEARTFQLKANIAQQLVDRCGFDAVLFEAPIYDFVGFEQRIPNGDVAQKQLDDAIGRFWMTRELANFRSWLFRNASTRQLVVGGIDDQVSITSHYARARLPGLIAAAAGSSECAQTATRNLQWTYNQDQPFDDAEKQRLQRCARSAADARRGDDEQILLRNFASYVDRQTDARSARPRDDVMVHNVIWHIGRMPRNSRIIIWTATVHAAKKRGMLDYEPLGAQLKERLGDRVAAIGFSVYDGHSAMAGRPAKPIDAAPAGSLEALTSNEQTEASYLSTPDLRKMGRVPSRLLGKFTAEDWSEYFDGVVVIRHEVAPTFEPWP